MDNGDNREVSAEATDNLVVTTETALQMAVEARDQYKRELEYTQRRLNVAQTNLGTVAEIVRDVLEGYTEGNIEFEPDHMRAICKALNIEVTRTVTFNVTASGKIEVKVNIFGEMPEDSDFDVEVTAGYSSDFDVEMSDVCLDSIEERY